jgi:signal transduction histidine kinase
MVAWLAEGGWAVAGVGALGAALARAVVCARAEAIARAVHELRGPLTAARLGLALGARTGELPPARLRAVDLELTRVAMALDDLGELGLAPGRPAPRRHPGVMSGEFDFAALLADSAEAWRPAAEAAGAGLEFEWRGGPARVRGERTRIAQATGNLIHNAIEHGGGVIEVRGSSGAARARVEVIDGGPGLPVPVAELVRRPRAGRGLHGRGLAIACEIARAHGGRIAAAPSHRGARLVLELPLAGGPARPSA